MNIRMTTLALLLMAGTASGQQDEQVTVINGIEWATRNVADSGSFAAKPDTCSHYYQWNRAVGWLFGSNLPWSETITDNEFKVNPCPSGWRLPTYIEMVYFDVHIHLHNTWSPAGHPIKGNSVAGYFVGPNHANATISNPGAAVFMPACGIFWGGNDVSYSEDGFYYFHAFYNGSNGISWFFNSQHHGGGGFDKRCAMSLRCVRAAWLTIDDIEWANSNLTVPGVFATQPDMPTEFYQWGRNVAQPATGSVTGWNTTPETSITTWKEDPCPKSWRLPTSAEFQALADEGYMWAYAGDMGNEVDGVFLGRNAGTCTLPDNMEGCVFLPANGARRNGNGLHIYENTSAFYWSSEQVNANNGRGFRVDEMGPSPLTPHKAFGYNIRCVHDMKIALGTSSSSTFGASISSITQASYGQAMADYGRKLISYSRAGVDTIIFEGEAGLPAELAAATLYPNPVTNGELTIDNGELAIGKVEVLNNSGAVVRTQDFGSQTSGTLQLHGLYGTYFVKVGGTMQSVVVVK